MGSEEAFHDSQSSEQGGATVKTLLIVLLALFLALPNFAAERGIKRVQLSSLAPVETPYLSGKYRALVIGNNNYDDPEKLWPSLKTAVADAEAVAEILKTDYGFAEITLLKNTKQRDIVRAFNQLVTNAQENDSVLIYYAGHGYLNEDTKEGFWIPVDAEGRDDSTFVSNAIIKTKLSVIADKARHVLLVSDSCFSGALLREGNRGMSLDQKNERYYQKVAKKKSVQILAAGGLEFVDDNYKGAGHSPFTYYLLQSLKDNNVRYFEATDLSQETSRNVSVNTQQTPESGVLQGAGHAGGEFFFLRKKTAGAKVSTPSAPASKPIVSAPRKYRADEEMWELVKDSYDSEDLNIFLEEHPESPLAGVARLKLKRLERKQAKAKAEEQQQLAEEEKRLEEERKQLEAEKQKIAEAKRKAEPERKKQQELAALRQKQESESKQSAKSPAGTVTDTSTGLMWQKRTDGREYNWEDARRYCNDLQLGGYLDWVLPSKEVLADMRDKKDIFGPYNRVYYWSSTNYMSSSSHAWHVGLYNDKVSDLIKTSSSSVRCVRGGRQNQAAIGPKQESTPSGTVIDQATGLMWQKEPFDYHFNWYGAVEYCKNLDLGGFNDWTLPEKGDYPDEKSKILKGEDRIHDGRYEQFWTLTEAMGFGAWTADFSEMNPDVYETKDKLKEYSVRCVRGEKKILAFIPSKPESTEAQPETVIDQATGLMWQYEQDGVIRNWEKAKKYCRSLFLGGYSDWELPSKEVLEDMLNKKDLFDPFELEQWYWTSTSNLKDKSRAWSVGFHYGYAERYSKNSGGYALCVRGGRQDQAAIGPKQESTPSGTVTDQATGLMWQKKSDGIERNWEAAKSYCGDLTLAGYSDWELPSKDVLKDMFEKKNLFDPYNRESWYWSSTSNVDSSSSAWFANFYSDSVFYGSKSGSYYARCVRDGSPEQQAKGPRSADGRYLDHGNGAIKDTRTGLMWTKKDSYADLGECLDWDDSRRYVSALRTGGYSDWRLPTVKELKGIYEGSKSNNMAYDHDSRYPLHLDSIFADWAAYFYWSSEEAGSCCARHVSFNPDQAYENHRAHCYDGGVRAVRSWKKEELAVLRPKQEALSSGTVIDQATGLIWQKKPDGGELNWEDAKSYCRNLQLGGYSDWELPSKEVLEDMLGKKNLFDPFKRGERYWTTSSVTYGGKPIPRIIDFDNDFVSSSDKHFGRHARCVRGGQQNQSAISSKQESSPSGTVFDSSTGLMWLKRPDGTERNWEKSKSYCRNLKLAGYSDWKLPSKDVLEDMLGKKNLFDPYNRESWYWSSTSNVDSSWFANFYSDSVFYGSKSGSYYVRCVRGGK